MKFLSHIDKNLTIFCLFQRYTVVGTSLIEEGNGDRDNGAGPSSSSSQHKNGEEPVVPLESQGKGTDAEINKSKSSGSSTSNSDVEDNDSNSDHDSSGSSDDGQKTGKSKKLKKKVSVKSAGRSELDTFFHQLVFDFRGSVTSHLSKIARSAIKEDKKIKNVEEFVKVKDEIEKRVLELLIELGCNRVPEIAVIRRIKGILDTKYPYMFSENPMEIVKGVPRRVFSERGTGGAKGVDGADKALQSKFNRMLSKHRCLTGNNIQLKVKELPKGKESRLSGPGGEPLRSQKGKHKIAHGVSQEKFYPKGDGKIQEFLQDYDVVDINDSDEKEALFEKYRETVQILISRRTTNFLSCVPGFFVNQLHLKNHFEALANHSVTEAIDNEIVEAFKDLKMVLNIWCQDDEELQNRKKYASLKRNECNGSMIPEYVHLLRELTLVWHENLGGFIRYEGEQESNSPHIVAYKSDPLCFSVCLEQTTVFQNLTFTCALASFFHLAFIGQVEYPKKGEAVAVWLQKKVARIDDKSK